MDTKEIMETSIDTINEFFDGQATGAYYDGTCYRLYLDKSDNTLFIDHQPSDQTWMQRDDGSLAIIYTVQGYCDLPEDALNA